MTPEQFTNWLALEGWHFVTASEDSMKWTGIQNDTTKECWLLMQNGKVGKGNYVPEARIPEANIMRRWHPGITERITHEP